MPRQKNVAVIGDLKGKMGRYEALRQEIKGMTPRTKLYKVLKGELKALGHWKDQPRGNPSAGFQAMGKGNDVD